MNVFEGTLRHEAGRTWVQAQGQQWPVGCSGDGRDGQAVFYGIRPGDIGIGDAASGIAAKVLVVEPTGVETELLLQVGENNFVVVLHGRTMVRPDDRVGLQIDAAKVHLFDRGGSKRIV